MMTAVITIVRRRPGVVASSTNSFFTCGCFSIALATSVVWPDLKVKGLAPSSFR
jgi:hypothetical protein